MRATKTALVALLFLVLFFYVYFFDRGSREETRRSLLSFNDSAIERVDLQYGAAEIRLDKGSSGHWTMTSPLNAAADDAAVAELLAAARLITISRTVAENPGRDELAAFGLEPPALVAILTQKGGAPLPRLAIGAKSPVSQGVYVRRGDRFAVHLIAAADYDRLIDATAKLLDDAQRARAAGGPIEKPS